MMYRQLNVHVCGEEVEGGGGRGSRKLLIWYLVEVYEMLFDKSIIFWSGRGGVWIS